jgi:hypothetical protein
MKANEYVECLKNVMQIGIIYPHEAMTFLPASQAENSSITAEDIVTYMRNASSLTNPCQEITLNETDKIEATIDYCTAPEVICSSYSEVMEKIEDDFGFRYNKIGEYLLEEPNYIIYKGDDFKNCCFTAGVSSLDNKIRITYKYPLRKDIPIGPVQTIHELDNIGQMFQTLNENETSLYYEDMKQLITWIIDPINKIGWKISARKIPRNDFSREKLASYNKDFYNTLDHHPEG